MPGKRVKKFYLLLIVSIVLSMFITTTACAATPKVIYYRTEADADIVKADYETASDAFDIGNTAMWTTLKAALITSLRNAQYVVVETTDNKYVDWLQAAMDGSTWRESQSEPKYLTNTPLANKELKADGSVEPLGGKEDDFVVVDIY